MQKKNLEKRFGDIIKLLVGENQLSVKLNKKKKSEEEGMEDGPFRRRKFSPLIFKKR